MPAAPVVLGESARDAVSALRLCVEGDAMTTWWRLKRTRSGNRIVWPMWVAWLMGGTWEMPRGGYGWQPGVLWLTVRYVRERWWQAGYSWWRFVDPRVTYWDRIP